MIAIPNYSLPPKPHVEGRTAILLGTNPSAPLLYPYVFLHGAYYCGTHYNLIVLKRCCYIRTNLNMQSCRPLHHIVVVGSKEDCAIRFYSVCPNLQHNRRGLCHSFLCILSHWDATAAAPSLITMRGPKHRWWVFGAMHPHSCQFGSICVQIDIKVLLNPL